MNRMDTCSREDLAITHEPTGATNQYAAKLLLAPFGNYATVLVQNPINFNPVLTSLDRLSFQWVDNGNITIDNDECEWNAVVQIQEQVTSPRVGSTIPKPPTKDEIAAQKAATAERERENALLRARSAAGAGSRGK